MKLTKTNIKEIKRNGNSLEKYVCDYILDEWEYDRNDLTEGYALAYVKNMDDDMCSEFGSIFIENRYGGLVRTA